VQYTKSAGIPAVKTWQTAEESASLESKRC